MVKNLTGYAVRILDGIGIKADEKNVHRQYSTSVRTDEFLVDGVTIFAEIVNYANGGYVVDIHFGLPTDGVLADTFMEYCAKKEKTPENPYGEYCHGPVYRTQDALRFHKNTHAISPWHNHSFHIVSEYYPDEELEDAVNNAIALAKQFSAHLSELKRLRYWKTTDTEVVAKVKEIVENADFHEEDVDRETGGHWLRDRNSFFRGWFYPFYDSGNGTFDTVYRPYGAAIGIEGSFEYAVSCLLLFDKDYIAKARKACRIRKETMTVTY